MSLTTDQRAAILAEIRDDPAGLGYLTGDGGKRHARADSGLGWHVLNVIRGKSRPVPAVKVPCSPTKHEARESAPSLLDAEIALRANHPTHALWYDDLPTFRGKVAEAVLDKLEACGLTKGDRAALDALGEREKPGEPVSRLDEIGLADLVTKLPASEAIAAVESILDEIGA